MALDAFSLSHANRLASLRHSLALGSYSIMARRLSFGKLTPTQVRRIRELKKSGLTCKEIAERFPVKEESIRRICNRETWDHVE